MRRWRLEVFDAKRDIADAAETLFEFRDVRLGGLSAVDSVGVLAGEAAVGKLKGCDLVFEVGDFVGEVGRRGLQLGICACGAARRRCGGGILVFEC